MRLRRVLVVALLAGGAIGFLPSPAAAEPGGATTAVNGTFAGTSGDDVLEIARDADVLTHNRFAAGDPGYVSAADFDSTVAGEQTKAVGSKITFNAGAGNDTLRVVGDLAFPVAAFDGNDGYDVLDMANAASAAAIGSGFGVTFPTVEQFVGTPGADVVQADAFFAGGAHIEGRAGDDTLAGTVGNDEIEGGAGANTLDGAAGNDALSVSVPLLKALRQVTGGAGDDTFTVRGSEGEDHLLVDGTQPTLVTDAANADGGYRTDAEHVIVGLNIGNDSVSLTPSPTATIVIDGASGDDSLTIDATKRAVSVTHDPAAADFVSVGGYGQVSALVLEHLTIRNEMVIATAPGPGGGPHVRTFRGDGSAAAGFFAYDQGFTGGVDVALGDLDGDRNDEIVTGAGPGGGPHVRVFRADGSDSGVGFFAYDQSFHGGVNVAAADVDGDGKSEIITTPATGGGPHVRIWSASGALRDEWMAPGFSNGGLHVARGARLGPNGGDQIVVSAVIGSSIVRFLNASGSPASQVGAWEPYAGFGGGAFVTRGSFQSATRGLDGYYDEFVSGPGAGGGPHVRVMEARESGQGFKDIGGFYAYDPNFHGGVAVTTCNPDGGEDEVVTAAGPGGGPHVRMFTKLGAPLVLSFMAYDPNFHGGVRIACGGARTR